MEPLKDASHLYAVERRAQHAERPGVRVLQGIGEYDCVPLV